MEKVKVYVDVDECNRIYRIREDEFRILAPHIVLMTKEELEFVKKAMLVFEKAQKLIEEKIRETGR